MSADELELSPVKRYGEKLLWFSMPSIEVDGIHSSDAGVEVSQPMFDVFGDGAMTQPYVYRHDGQPIDEEAWLREGVIRSLPAPVTSHRADAPLDATGGGAGPRTASTASGHDGQAGDTSRAGNLAIPAREVPIYPTTPDHPKWTELTQ